MESIVNKLEFRLMGDFNTTDLISNIFIFLYSTPRPNPHDTVAAGEYSSPRVNLYSNLILVLEGITAAA